MSEFISKKYNPENWKKKLEEAINETNSMEEARRLLKLSKYTFLKMTKALGIYKPNKAGKGIHKKRCPTRSLEEILKLNSGYQSHKLKLRLLNEGYKEHICESCGLSEWLGKPIPLELHHIDGNKENNSLENLQILCPNCHALTDTYRSKNIPLLNKKNA